MSEEAANALFVILGLIFQEKVPPAFAGTFGLDEPEIKLLCWVVLIAVYLLLIQINRGRSINQTSC